MMQREFHKRIEIASEAQLTELLQRGDLVDCYLKPDTYARPLDSTGVLLVNAGFVAASMNYIATGYGIEHEGVSLRDEKLPAIFEGTVDFIMTPDEINFAEFLNRKGYKKAPYIVPGTVDQFNNKTVHLYHLLSFVDIVEGNEVVGGSAHMDRGATIFCESISAVVIHAHRTFMDEARPPRTE